LLGVGLSNLLGKSGGSRKDYTIVKQIECETGGYMELKSNYHQSISAVIPTLGNRIPYLIEAMKSIESQTLCPNEILIVNNGEISSEVLFSHLSSNIALKIVDTIYRAGVSQARNFGATIAEGKYVAFLDDDDFWEPDYLEEMYKEIVRSNAKCAISKIAKLEDGKVANLFDATEYLTQRYFLLMNPGVTGSNVIVDKDYFLSLGGYDCMLPTGEDGDLILKFLDKGDDIAVCSATQAVMRVHKGERLTSHESLASGYKALYLKYKHRLGARDTMYLIWRYKREEYRSEKNLTKFLRMLFWSGIIVLIRRTPKSIYVMQK